MGLEKPPHERRRRDAERKEVAKTRPLPVEKSRYGSYRARTVNRTRRMRREKRSRREKGSLVYQAAEKRLKQLFSTNTGLCETERRGIWADDCPVLEG